MDRDLTRGVSFLLWGEPGRGYGGLVFAFEGLVLRLRAIGVLRLDRLDTVLVGDRFRGSVRP